MSGALAFCGRHQEGLGGTLVGLTALDSLPMKHNVSITDIHMNQYRSLGSIDCRFEAPLDRPRCDEISGSVSGSSFSDSQWPTLSQSNLEGSQ